MGLRLRDVRRQRGVSLVMLAGMVGVSAAHLANAEHATKTLSLDTLVAVVIALDVSLDYIVLGIRNYGGRQDLRLRSDDELIQYYLEDPDGLS